MKINLAILFISLLLASCQQTGGLVPIVETGERKNSHSKQIFHEVHAGETLYSIAWRYGIDYRELASLNKIKSPYTIFINQKLKLHPVRHVAKKATAPGKKINRVKKLPPGSKSRSRVAGNSTVKWHWPLEGSIVKKFSLKGDVNKGLDIAGKEGQSVVSAAAGMVVYAGGGLRGYGKLVIVKHNDHYLSAYGNNSKILVKEGDKVGRGKVIARLGLNGSVKAAREVLHFEIRRDGKPENPLKYLPVRN